VTVSFFYFAPTSRLARITWVLLHRQDRYKAMP
jgi:hypothetical protein